MKPILLLTIITFILIIFYIKYTLSLPEAFTTFKTCTVTFGSPCSSETLNDALLGCNGTKVGGITASYVNEVYVNQTFFLSSSGIDATCEFHELGNTNNTEYIWYYNGSNWYNIFNQSFNTSATRNINRTVSFKLNSSTGIQIIRCIIANVAGQTGPVPTVSGECANSTYTTATKYDNDDVNFTVTDYPKYTFWNLTNYTTGETIQDGSHLTRNDKINASAQWDKRLSDAIIRHNGTGTFQNYTVSISGNWTNYTLDLSNTAEFNRTGRIEISYIWVNDTYGLENFTSSKHFYLWGNSKLGQMYINSSSI
jgi:hypothetical protein